LNVNKLKKRKNMNTNKVKEILMALRNSCYEGWDGTWDVSTGEGRDAFLCMADDCEDIARELGIELEPYDSDKLFSYRLDTGGLITSFTEGIVEAKSIEEARVKALDIISYNISKVNDVFEHTINFNEHKLTITEI